MSQSIKLNDNNFVDATGVWDSHFGRTLYDTIGMLSVIRNVPYTELPSQSTDSETYFNEWHTYCKNQGWFSDNRIIVGIINPNMKGFVIGYYNSNDYSCFMAMRYGGTTLHRFGVNNGTWFYSEVN